MCKRFFLLGIFLFLTSAAAGFDGFYIGGSAGGSVSHGKQSGTNVSTVGVPGNVMVLTEDLRTTVFNGCAEGTLFVGYDASWCSFFYGLEGFVRLSSNNFDVDMVSGAVVTDAAGTVLELFSAAIHSNIKVGPCHFGFDERFGFYLNPSLRAYFRLGVEWAKLQLHRNVNFAGVDVTPFNLSFIATRRRYNAHLRVGMGIEKEIGCSCVLRADYIFTSYGRVKINGFVSDTQFGVPVSIVDNPRIHLWNHAISVGVDYYFCGSPGPYSECFCPNFSGFYLAGGIGGSILDNHLRGTHDGIVVFPSTQIADFPIKLPHHLTQNTFAALLYAGYGWKWSCFYTGLEAFVRYANMLQKRSDTNDFVKVGVEFFITNFSMRTRINPWQFGIHFRPGYFITPSTLFFGTIGTTLARLKVHSDATGDFEDFAPTFNLHPSLTLEKKEIRASLDLGLGLEYAFCPCWHLRADYQYSRFGRITLQGSTTVAAESSSGTLIHDSRIDFNVHALTLGLSKYF